MTMITTMMTTMMTIITMRKMRMIAAAVDPRAGVVAAKRVITMITTMITTMRKMRMIAAVVGQENRALAAVPRRRRKIAAVVDPSLSLSLSLSLRKVVVVADRRKKRKVAVVADQREEEMLAATA